MWTFRFRAPDGLCRLLVVVDDLLFSEDASLDRRLSRAICAHLSLLFGDVRYDPNPTSFKGFSISRDRPTRSLSLTGAANVFKFPAFTHKINERFDSCVKADRE